MRRMKEGDQVRVFGRAKVATITAVVDETIIVRFPDGDRMKTRKEFAEIVPDNEITITPDKFDQAVNAMLHAMADDVADKEERLRIIEPVYDICQDLKERLFNGH